MIERKPQTPTGIILRLVFMLRDAGLSESQTERVLPLLQHPKIERALHSLEMGSISEAFVCLLEDTAPPAERE